MRIDEIDLYGNLLISGFTGSEGQILTYNTSGGFDWGTASGGSSGPTSSYFKTSGYNYVICETVNNGVDPAADAITNGDNLINAYALAKTLDVGTKSVTNRLVVLLMPGDYDLSSAQFLLDTSFIDIVGISSNPYDTILRSSTQYATLFYTTLLDSALKNLHLKQGTILSVSDYEGGGNGSYLRWENVILSGNTFWNGGGDYGFTNIYGEFKNIKVLDNCYSFVGFATIDGIFDSIEVGDGAYAFYTNSGGGDIRGTYSNIEIGDNSFGFQSGGGFSGRYENIKAGLNTSVYTSNNGDISGYFENIKTTSSDSFVINTSGDITGTFKNLNLAGSAQIFQSYNNIDGVFENIEIGDSNYVFSLGGSGYITGTFSNIKIGNLTNYAFKYGDPISGSFKNITIGNTSDAFFSNTTSLIGTYEDITIGNVTNDVFKATDMISGSFKNIKIGDITNNNAFYADSASGQIVGTFDEIQIGNIASTTGYFFSSGATVSGTFSNIEIGDASEWATGGIKMFCLNSSGSITGSYKNIKVSNTSFLFYPTNQDLNGTFENIEFGSTSYAFYTNSGSILGTYSNIKSFSQQENFFNSATDLIGTFENIEISNSIATSAFSAINSLSGTFKNIKLGDLSGIDADVFISGVTDLTGTFENIEVGVGNSSYIVFKSGDNISGTFSNITVGDGWNSIFDCTNYFYGYYKDIKVGSCVSGIFKVGQIPSGTLIDNLYSLSNFTNNSVVFGGKIINSTVIEASPWYINLDYTTAIIENCKFINDNSTYNIIVGGGEYPSTAEICQILYTAVSSYIQGTEIDFIVPNYNIEANGTGLT